MILVIIVLQDVLARGLLREGKASPSFLFPLALVDTDPIHQRLPHRRCRRTHLGRSLSSLRHPVSRVWSSPVLSNLVSSNLEVLCSNRACNNLGVTCQHQRLSILLILRMLLPGPHLFPRLRPIEHTVPVPILDLALVLPREAHARPLAAVLHVIEGIPVSLSFPQVEPLVSQHRPSLGTPAAGVIVPDQDRGHPGASEREGPADQVEVSVIAPILVSMEGTVVDEDTTGIVLLGPERPPPRNSAPVVVRVF